MKYFPFTNFWSSEGTYRFILHEHDAEKAGLHYDLRIEVDTPKNYISSLAGRNILKLFLKKEDRILLIPQDLHHQEWLHVKNTVIKKGYGKGQMKMVIKGIMKVESVSRNSMKVYFHIEECGKDVLTQNQCETLKEKPFPAAFVSFGRNILMVRGKN